MGENKVNDAIVAVTQVLVSANTALPILLTTIDAVALLIQAATGSGPSVAERAEIIRANIQQARAFRDGELERLQALIDAQQALGGNGTDD